MYITCLTPTELKLMSENKLNKEKRTLPIFSLLSHPGQWLSHSSCWVNSQWSMEGHLIYLLVFQGRKLRPREGMQPTHTHIASCCQNPFSALYPWYAGWRVWILGLAQLTGCWVTQDVGGLGIHPWCLGWYNAGWLRLAEFCGNPRIMRRMSEISAASW